MDIKNEADFISAFANKPKLFLKNARKGVKEIPLYRIKDLLNPEYTLKNPPKGFGYIDLGFMVGQKRYLAEVKFITKSENTTDQKSRFWNALKILGYVEYFKWYYKGRSEGRPTPHPAIFCPIKWIGAEQRIICSNLNIQLYGIVKKGGNIYIETVPL